MSAFDVLSVSAVALRKESVDRNLDAVEIVIVIMQSLSARRAWIEIRTENEGPSFCELSLSARRAWIEITAHTAKNTSIAGRSPQGERG